MDSNRTLFVGSIIGLAVLNVYAFRLPTIIAAAILGLAVIFCLRGLAPPHFAVAVFLLAELSPISLWASFPVALAYQGLCILLLVTTLSLRDSRKRIALYKKATLQIAALALLPLALFVFLMRINALGLSANKIMSLCVTVLLAVLCTSLAAEHYDVRIFEEVDQ